jgi:hypothetical protein
MHVVICTYGGIAGIAIFYGDMLIKNYQGARFINKKTGGYHESSLLMHLKYFFLYEQRMFGCVVIICVVMSIALSIFFIYHINLARNNETTNESFKRGDMSENLKFEAETVQSLLDEATEWKPASVARVSSLRLKMIKCR